MTDTGNCFVCNQPLKKSFCCYVIIGPQACLVKDKKKFEAAITDRCLTLKEGTIMQTGTFNAPPDCTPSTINCSVKLKTLKLFGCVTVDVSVPITGICNTKASNCCQDVVCIDDDKNLCICCPTCQGINLDLVQVNFGNFIFKDPVLVNDEKDEKCKNKKVYLIEGTFDVTVTCPVIPG